MKFNVEIQRQTNEIGKVVIDAPNAEDAQKQLKEILAANADEIKWEKENVSVGPWTMQRVD